MKNWAKYISKFLPIIFSLVIVFNLFIPFLGFQTVRAQEKTDDIRSLTENLNKKRDEVNEGGLFKEIKKSELKTIAKNRKAKLKERLKTNPREVLDNAVNPEDFPEDVRGDLEKKVSQQGIVGVIHKTESNGRDKYFLYKDKNDTRDALEIVTEDPETVPTGPTATITVNGLVVDSQIVAPTAENSALFDPSIAQYVGSSGAKKVAIYYVNFLDDTGRSLPDYYLKDYFNSDFNQFLGRSSHDKISVFAPNVYRVDMIMNKKCDINALSAEATRAAMDQFFVNPADFDVNAIIFDSDCGGGPPGQAIVGTSWFFSVGMYSIPHEFGHVLGLAHAYGYYCGDTTIRDSCNWIEYRDPSDIMGAESGRFTFDNAPDYGPFAKESLGWLIPGEIMDVSASGDYALHKFEDPGSGSKVAKIRTFSGGPVYYVFYKQNAFGGYGPVITLASSTLCCYRRTLLLDTTPGSQFDVDHVKDFDDAYLHDGQKFQDPFNGISVTSQSRRVSDVTVHIDVGQPVDGSGTLRVNWSRPTGYFEAIGQQKTVDVAPVHYLVDLKCSYGAYCANQWNQWVSPPGCSAWPTGTCPPFDTTNSSIDVLVSAGFRYQYQVWILTRDDLNPNGYRPYLWIGETEVNNTCASGTCSLNISWPKATYKVRLYRDDNNDLACTGNTLGCTDYMYSYETTSFKFRGIPKGVGYHANVKTTDFNGNDHLLQDIFGLGTSTEDVKSCSSSETRCDIPSLSFQGNQPITYSVKLNNSEGVVVSGPFESFANQEGGVSRSWSWDYALAAFPVGFDNCYVALEMCKVGSLAQSSEKNFSYLFQGLLPLENYKYFVCAKTCNSTAGSIIKNGTAQSDGLNITQFFSDDPFPGASVNKYTGEYYDNADFTNLKFTRLDSRIKFQWQNDSPDSSIAPTSYSVRWRGDFDFTDAVYRFMFSSNDGAKVYVDGVKQIDTSVKGVGATAIRMVPGQHNVVVEMAHGNNNTGAISFAFVKAYSCFDLNADGLMNSADQLLVLKHFGEKGLTAWDLDGNLVVNSGDQLKLATAIRNKLSCTS